MNKRFHAIDCQCPECGAKRLPILTMEDQEFVNQRCIVALVLREGKGEPVTIDKDELDASERVGMAVTYLDGVVTLRPVSEKDDSVGT